MSATGDVGTLAPGPAREADSEAGLDFAPVPPWRLQPASRFAGTYAGEHVAGTEFVIGALFVGAGAAAGDVILGLVIGNALAVLTWALVTAPIAVATRLSLYAYLRKIAGPDFLKLYSVINGVMFLGLAGAMITVSASAVRVLYNATFDGDIATQTGLWPTDLRFVLVALLVGAVVVALAVMGFKRLAQFAAAVVPWMICMFLVGAVALYPALALNAGLALPALAPGDVWTVLSTQVYRPTPMEGAFWAIPNEAKSIWSIAAFAWVANLAMHGALGDMTLLRFAKCCSYGWFSALGMFIGHFAAWVLAGVMGAGAALALQTTIAALDPGDVATQALGGVGILAVIIAGWTTSNPTLYRAGLAFQSLNPRWSRARVTAVVGGVTMIVACSPFVFLQLLGYVGWMGLILSPVGAVIVAEHWLFPRLGLNRYWATHHGRTVNLAALAAWAAALAVILALYFGVGIHQFFLLIPAWLTATAVYVALARALGAGRPSRAADAQEAAIAQRRRDEAAYLASGKPIDAAGGRSGVWLGAQVLAFAALGWMVIQSARVALADAAAYPAALEAFRAGLVWPTLIFFAAAAIAVAVPGGPRERTAAAG